MLARSLVTLTLLIPSSALAGFDPESYTSDATLFSDLPVQDFQTLAPTWGGSYLEEAPLLVDDLAYWGNLWPSTSFCIPTMDSGGVCGGSNVYLASAVDLHIVPMVPIDRIGFRFASQGSEFWFEVALSDGSVRAFAVNSSGVNQWGSPNSVSGFFGYGTGDAALTIEQLWLHAPDGGIDDIRYGVATTTGTCDELEAMIRALALDRGIERSFIAKVEASDRLIEGSRIAAAIQVLDALIAEIGAQAGVHLDAADAEALGACVAARRDTL